MNVAIVTSGDYIYAGDVFVDAKSKGHNVSFVDVSGGQKNLFLKKLKLSFLFGFLDSLRLLFLSHRTKKIIKRSGDFRIIHRNNVESVLLDGSFDLIVLINYAWRFPVHETINVVNCHPSLLPKYRGLMPISHAVNDALSNNLTKLTTGVTIHQIDENFDMGRLVCRKSTQLSLDTSLFDFYRISYSLISDCLDQLIRCPEGTEKLTGGNYHSSMSVSNVFQFKIKLLKHNKFIKFIINGGLIGIFSWLFQVGIYLALETYVSHLENKMLLSVYGAFLASAIISFHSLKIFVFKSDGYIYRFLAVTTAMIIVVGLLAELVFFLLNPIEPIVSAYFSYPISALVVAPFSFFLKNKLVFIK